MSKLTQLKILAAAVLVVAAAVLTTAAGAANQRGAVIKVGRSSLGRIIVDSHGRTLYLSTRDKRHTSTCYGKCAIAWPPLTTHGKPRALSGARSALLGTTRRRNGSIQVTYHGHPLYHFAGDRRAGQTTGEGLHAFGGRWYAVSTAGTAVQKRSANAFNAKLTHGVLAIAGTKASDKIALRLQARRPGILQVDVGDNGSADFSFTRKSIAKIAVNTGAGADVVRIDERNGVFTDSIRATIDGGAGDDVIAGGSGAETLLGGDGNDSLDGNGGSDLALLGAGDDTFVWDPGDGSDTVDGQAGTDALRFNGADTAERIDLSANGNRLRLFRDVGTITIDTAGVERVDVNALGGADLVTVNDLLGTGVGDVNVDLAGGSDSESDHVIVNGANGDDALNVDGDSSAVAVSGLSARVAIQHSQPIDQLTVNGLAGDDRLSAAALAAPITLTLDGGAGADMLAGGKGTETLSGGDGNDSLDGNGGNDLGLLGAGDDTFVWDPGDGSDTVEGQDGADTLRFNGANAAEQIDLSANGNRLKLFRDVGSITMDTAGVERVDVNALGGADVVTANDPSGTGVTDVNVDLAGALGGTTGDGQADRVIVNATNGDDTINVNGDAESVRASGLAATVQILHPEVAGDRLEINTLAGADTVNAAGLAAGAIQLLVDGGAGDDTLAGGQGIETLSGGDGNDSLDGNGSNDLGLLGAGDDTFVWDPGDGSDTVEGQDGADTLRFNGADVAERIALSANGNRFELLRDPGRITMDTAGVERVDVNALGGADVVTADDLSGTGVTDVNLDLAGTLGGTTGDDEADRVTVDATNDDDTIRAGGDAAVTVSGLSARLAIHHQEPGDELEIDGLGGNDDISAATLAAQAIDLTLDGGAGDDELFGGQGRDQLVGGDGNDVLDGFKGDDLALLGAGDDTFAWDPGDGSDTVEGQDGIDTLSFIGANVAEQIDLSAVGNRVRFVRDIGNVTMDMAGIEQVDFEALGGADLVTVNDLTGTDLGFLQVDLEGTPGAGDGQPDRIVVNATNGDDTIEVRGNADVVKTGGLAPTIVLLHPEGANDRLEINTLAGTDTVDSSGLAAGAIQLLVDGALTP
jgi:predicted lipoprotein with Yx(FWY)xxD motif